MILCYIDQLYEQNCDCRAAIQPCARQCFEQIIAAEIHVVRHLMDQIQKMSNMLQPEAILPEVWDILDLRLNCFDSYEALTNNFQVRVGLLANRLQLTTLPFRISSIFAS